MTGTDVQIAAKGIFVIGVAGIIGQHFMAAAVAEPEPLRASLDAVGTLGSAAIGYLGLLTVGAALKP